jgi:hypothetical protein
LVQLEVDLEGGARPPLGARYAGLGVVAVPRATVTPAPGAGTA